LNNSFRIKLGKGIKILIVHNVGMATLNLDKAVQNYKILGFKVIDNSQYIDNKKNIKSVRIKDSEGKILEILETNNKDNPSAISKFLEDTNIPVLAYYIGPETSDIHAKVDEMKSRGYIILENISFFLLYYLFIVSSNRYNIRGAFIHFNNAMLTLPLNNAMLTA